MAPAKGRSALETDAWAANPWAEKSIPVPVPATRERNTQETTVIDSLRWMKSPIPNVVKNQPIH